MSAWRRRMSKLSIGHYIKKLKLVERNKKWLSSKGISTKDKLSYYGRIALSCVACKKKIQYLGSTFYYDNPATPLTLQNYPYEITVGVLANMHKNPKTILDIGGNLGQFSLTINHILKGSAIIDIFEPNSYVYELLKKNTVNKNNIHIYNYGLGDSNAKKVLNFDPNRTSIGSVLEKNAGEGASEKQEIIITSSPQKITKRKRYDLIKIDVEGYEMHVVKGLAGITCKYLFIEFTGQTKEKDYMHSEIMTLLKEQWGEYDIYYCGGFNSKDSMFDMLIRFRQTVINDKPEQLI